MVQLSVFTTPRVRLHFPATQELCQVFTNEFVRLSESFNDYKGATPLEDAVSKAIQCLKLPLDAMVEIPTNGHMVITLDLNPLLASSTPSVAYH